jgi:hypothetical protein
MERCWNLKACANIHCAKRNRLGPERAATLTCVHYNKRLRQAREDPTFEPVCLPPMVLDPIQPRSQHSRVGMLRQNNQAAVLAAVLSQPEWCFYNYE